MGMTWLCTILSCAGCRIDICREDDLEQGVGKKSGNSIFGNVLLRSSDFPVMLPPDSWPKTYMVSFHDPINLSS